MLVLVGGIFIEKIINKHFFILFIVVLVCVITAIIFSIFSIKFGSLIDVVVEVSRMRLLRLL